MDWNNELIVDQAREPLTGTVFSTDLTTWRESIQKILDRAGIKDHVKGRKRILIKPNLVEAIPPPVTTPAALVEALVEYLQDAVPDVPIVIGEGTGATEYDTFYPFIELGYAAMAAGKGVELVDLNEAPLVKLSNPECKRWPEMYLPAIAFESYLISVPVLKAHTLADVTLTMKNMMGMAPPAYYRQGGNWKKASFHDGIQEAIFDLNRYRTPDFSMLDASVGMSQAHLGGPICDPPPNLLVAGFDPVAIDAYGASLLEKNWRDIGHIEMADGKIGTADSLVVIKA